MIKNLIIIYLLITTRLLQFLYFGRNFANRSFVDHSFGHRSLDRSFGHNFDHRRFGFHHSRLRCHMYFDHIIDFHHIVASFDQSSIHQVFVLWSC